MIRIVHARSTENKNSGWDGKAKAGDQTGNEVSTSDFYKYPWGVMLRYYNWEIAEKASQIAVKLANSNLVGYDQSQRNTLYQALKKYDFNVDAYITSGEKTETDCSAFIYACFCCLIPDMRSDANAPRTATMREFFKSHGFIEYTDAEHLNSTGKLLAGDIEVAEGNHTCMAYDTNKITSNKYSSAVDSALTVLAYDVISGHWGNGEDRKNNLYRAIQDRVNSML